MGENEKAGIGVDLSKKLVMHKLFAYDSIYKRNIEIAFIEIKIL